jgi:hypothetical protein
MHAKPDIRSLQSHARGGFVRLGKWLQTYWVILAGITGGIWAGGTFFYNNVVLPAQRPPYLSATISTQELDKPVRGLLPVLTKITLSNDSKRDLLLFAAWFAIEGVKIEPQSLPDTAYSARVRRDLADLNGVPRAYSEGALVLRSGKLWEARKLGDGEKMATEFITYVPSDSFHLLRTNVRTIVAKEIGRMTPDWVLLPSGLLRVRPALLVSYKGPGTGTYRPLNRKRYKSDTGRLRKADFSYAITIVDHHIGEKRVPEPQLASNVQSRKLVSNASIAGTAGP